MPDVLVFYEVNGWLVLIGAVTGHGPMSPKRHGELKTLFEDCTAGLVFVTAFLSRRELTFTFRVDGQELTWVSRRATGARR